MRRLPKQLAFHGLRLCIASAPVLLARTLGCNRGLFKEWDQGIETFLHDLVTPEKDRDWTILSTMLIHLKQSLGGAGVYLAEQTAPLAFQSALLNTISVANERGLTPYISDITKSVVQKGMPGIEHEELNKFLAKLNSNELKNYKLGISGLQRQLNTKYNDVLADQLRSLMEQDQFKAFRQSFEDRQSNYNNVLFSVLPSHYAYRVEDEVYAEALRQRLMHVEPHRKTCGICKSEYTETHRNACATSGANGSRHKWNKRLRI